MIIDEEVYLEHWGVKGMHWGVHNSGGASRSVNRHAKRDAAEFARAQAFYGKGAGTRRKLIKQTVDGKSKRMPGYSTAFHKHLASQDPSHHAVKAVSERHSIDRKEKTRQTAGAVARRITGEQGTRAAFVAAAMGGAAYLHSAKGQAHMKKAAGMVGHIATEVQRKNGVRKINNLIKNMGA